MILMIIRTHNKSSTIRILFEATLQVIYLIAWGIFPWFEGAPPGAGLAVDINPCDDALDPWFI